MAAVTDDSLVHVTEHVAGNMAAHVTEHLTGMSEQLLMGY